MNTDNKQNYELLYQQITQAKKIVITAHQNPDGDAIGSSLGLYWFFKNLNFDVSIIIPNEIPSYLYWLEGLEDIMIFENGQLDAIRKIGEANLIFSLDYNALSRVKTMSNYLKHSKAFKVLIDHHPDPEIENFDMIFSETSSSSTAELLFTIINYINEKFDLQSINKSVAEAIYTGILTDTGGFKHGIEHKEVFETTAKLIGLGVNAQVINKRIFDAFTENRLRLLGFCLSERLIVIPEHATAIIYLTKEDLLKYNYKVGDTEGVVNYGLSMKGINLAILLMEKKNEIKISLRSKVNFSVNQFARLYFNGGGHDRAAGGTSKKGMEETINEIKMALPNYTKVLNSVKELGL